MNNDLLLERIGKEMDIAVGCIRFSADPYLINASEKIAVCKSDGKSVRIIAQIVEDCVQLTVCGQYLIIEAFLKHVFEIGSFVDHYFENCDFAP